MRSGTDLGGGSSRGNADLAALPGSYSFGFMAASLRPELGRILAELYLAEGDWGRVKSRVLGTNALQLRGARSSVRLERELRLRLQRLTRAQLTLLATATAEDRAAISWLAAIKHARFVFEFAAEVLRDKLESHDPVLRYSDYETYVDTKSTAHPELGRLKASSLSKIRQILLNMLAEAGLIGTQRDAATIQRPVLSPAVVSAIVSDDRRWLAGFLFTDDEIKGLGRS